MVCISLTRASHSNEDVARSKDIQQRCEVSDLMLNLWVNLFSDIEEAVGRVAESSRHRTVG